MRFMIIRKADPDTEAGVMPTEELIAEMMAYNQRLSDAGALVDLELRQVFADEDFGEALTPELQRQADAMRERPAGGVQPAGTPR